MERERAWNIIRGCVVTSYLETADKTEVLAFIDAQMPPCETCGAEMVPESMKCPECGPTP